mgnify:CR=1 FL=1
MLNVIRRILRHLVIVQTKLADFAEQVNAVEAESALKDIHGIQGQLVMAQVKLAELAEQLVSTPTGHDDKEVVPEFEAVNEGIKITVPEFPPRVAVFDRTVFENGKPSVRAYMIARDRWYLLIRKALEGYEGESIDPALVYIIYYVPRLCDVGNFVEKFIIDGLMYAGAIAEDDNLKHVHVIAREARIDKERPRTEIYVVKHEGQVRNLVLSKFNLRVEAEST